MAAAEMEPPLRPSFTVKDFEGKTVVAVEISEVPANRKPCYYKIAGLQKGAYIRVGNTNRQMTDYEIYGYASFQTQPTIDQEIVPYATLEDFDQNRLTQYMEELKRTRPQAGYLKQPFEKILKPLAHAPDGGSASGREPGQRGQRHARSDAPGESRTPAFSGSPLFFLGDVPKPHAAESGGRCLAEPVCREADERPSKDGPCLFAP